MIPSPAQRPGGDGKDAVTSARDSANPPPAESRVRASHAPRVLCIASPLFETVPPDEVAAALAAGVASAGGRPSSMLLDRSGLPDLLTGSALCIVSMDFVGDSILDDGACAEIVGSTRELGIPCVILGARIERDAAYRLLRRGVRAISPLGHPGRTRERARRACRGSLERHAHHATIHFSRA